MPDQKKNQKKKWLAIAGWTLFVLWLSYLTLVSSPIAALFYFAAFLAATGQLLWSVVNTRRQRAMLLREAASAPPTPRLRQPATIAEHRVFRYHFSRFGIAAFLIMGLASLAGSAAALLDWFHGHSPARDADMPLFWMFFGLGTFLLVLLWRQLTASVRTDSEGITAWMLTKTVQISWQEVSALQKQFMAEYAIGGAIGTTAYRVFAPRKTLEFYDSLTDYRELLALIEAATGLDWN